MLVVPEYPFYVQSFKSRSTLLNKSTTQEFRVKWTKDSLKGLIFTLSN